MALSFMEELFKGSDTSNPFKCCDIKSRKHPSQDFVTRGQEFFVPSTFS